MAPEKPPKDRPTRRVPGLFQHIGVHSTLANKTQSLKDNTFRYGLHESSVNYSKKILLQLVTVHRNLDFAICLHFAF